MKTIVLAIVAGAGTLLVTSLQASAMPVNGAAIAHIGQQVDPVLNAARKKTKRCLPDQKRDRFGYCIPNANL
jgi:hypothetical protein